MNGMFFERFVVYCSIILYSAIERHPRFVPECRRHRSKVCDGVYRERAGQCPKASRPKLRMGTDVSDIRSRFSWALTGDRGGYHTSRDPRAHYLVRGFRADGHAYKSFHLYSVDDRKYYNKSGGKFRKGKRTLHLALECENLGYVIRFFPKFVVHSADIL